METQNTTILDYYQESGFKMVRLSADAKRAVDEEWQLKDVPLEELKAHVERGRNVGLQMGEVSNWLGCIEVDCPEAVALAPKFLPDTLTAGRNAEPRHYLYRSPGLGYKKFLGGTEELMSIKASNNGAGHYVVVEPSRHPDKGRYLWRDGFNPAIIAEVSALELKKRAELLAVAVLIARHLPPEGRHHLAMCLAGYMLRNGETEEDVLQVLEAAWSYHNAPRDAFRDLRGIVPDTSENLERGEPTTGGGQLEELIPGMPRKIAKFLDWDWKRVNYDGAVFKHPGGNSANTANIANGTSDENEPWEPPAPFYEYDLPPFPTGALPSWAAEFACAEAEATQTPEDLAGSLVLAVGALALAKVIEVEPWPGWREPVNLFTATAMPSGSRKTRVFKDVLAPVYDFEKKAIKDAVPEMARARARYNIYEQRLQKSQKAAANADEDELDIKVGDTIAAAEQLAKIKIPAEPRLLADDASPEKLASLLAEHAGRMALMSPEGDVFDIMAGRYSQGVPNLGVYLKGHAGDALRVDRVGRVSESVEAPALTIGLAVQPEVLRGLVDKPGFRGRGLLGRFLYGLPPSNLGSRNQEPEPVEDRVRAAYRFSVKTLLALAGDVEPGEELNTAVVKLSEEAKAELKGFMAWIEPQLTEQGALGSMTDWAGKLAGAAVRIAGVLHAMKFVESQAEGTPAELASRFITADTMSRALQIANYFRTHAQAAFAEMGADPVVEGAKHILRWIDRKEVAEFTKREAFEGTKGRFHKVTEMGPALDLLEAHGHIRVKSSGTKDPKGRGRPSIRYEVNPLKQDKITRIAYSQNSQYSQKY